MKSQTPRLVSRLLWTGGEGVTIGRMLAAGALVWGAYSAVELLVNGVILDEVVEPVQVITGAVRYPLGHPHQIYYLRAYNLFYYLGASLWTIKPDPILISAIRNVLFLFLSTFVPFALAVVLTRRPLWGHVASTLTITETTMLFKGVYPMWVFPVCYSNGHFGVHIALLTVTLLLARLWKSGGVLLGLLPALHPLMPIIVWPWAAIYIFRGRRWQSSQDRTRLVAATCLGLLICVLVALPLFTRTTNASVATPYDTQADGESIHRQFTLTTDIHRQLPKLESAGYMTSPIAFFVIGILLWRTTKKESSQRSYPQLHEMCSWILLLGGIVGVYVYGSWLFLFLRGSLPSPLEMSMPFRFSNVYVLLLLPITVAAIASAHEAMTERVRPFAIALLTALVLIAGRYMIITPGGGAEHLIFLTWGLLFAMMICAYLQDRRRLLQSLLAIAVVGGTLLLWRRVEIKFVDSIIMSAVIFGVGATIFQRLNLNPRRWGLLLHLALFCACVMTCVAALPGHKIDLRGSRRERWDMVSPYDLELNRWLAANTRPDEMILTSVFPTSKLQPKTGHPVLMERETFWLMTYMPSLSSTIGVMGRDLYGIDYTNQEKLNRITTNGRVILSSAAVMETWKKRRRDEWQSLGQKYGFRLVFADTKVALDLPVALPGQAWTLYVIPEGLTSGDSGHIAQLSEIPSGNWRSGQPVIDLRRFLDQATQQH